MAYGSVKVDTIIFDNAGIDQNVTVSGLYRATTSGITVSGTVSGATIIGSTLVSGGTVTGTIIQGTTIQGVSGTFTSLTGTTTTGTTANFASGVFSTQVSGLVITGNTGQFTSGAFTSLVSTTGNFTSVTGTTILGTTGTFTSLTGTTTTGTTATFTTGDFTTLSGTTINLVSGIVDPNGAFLVGTSAARNNFGLSSLSASLQVEGTSYNTSSLSLTANGAITSGNPSPVLHFARSRGGSVGSNTSVLSGDVLGFIDFEGSDGTNFPIGARIRVAVDGTPNSGSIPGRIAVFTTAEGSGNPTERVRIDSAGRLLVGITNPGNYAISGSPNLQVEGTTPSNSQIGLIRNENNTGGSAVILGKSRGTTNGSNAIVLNNDTLGTLVFEGADGSTATRGASIAAVVNGTPGVGDMPSRLVFSTSSGINLVEQMRITSSGVTTANNLTVPSINNGALAGTRNRIINGDMRISQRGTSFPAAVNGYNLDRWQWAKLGAMVCTVSQDSDVPNSTFQNSYKVDVTTADTSIGSTDYATVIQRIEGYNVRDLIGTTFTLSFWVKSPKTGTHCVAFRNNAQNRSFIATYSITAINTWEYKTVTVTGGLINDTGWDWTNGTGLEVAFMLASGSAYQTTADTWRVGNFLSTSAQVNVMDNVANDFFLTGVQLEPGTVATPFERRSIEQELQFCYRYFRLLSYYGGAFTGANVCYFSPEGINDFRGDPAISSTVNGFQFYNGTIWTSVSTGSGAALSIFIPPALPSTRAIQVTGLTGNGTTIPTPTSVGINGTLSAEL